MTPLTGRPARPRLRDLMSALDPVWTHPESGATLWVGGRYFTREQIEAAGIDLIVSTVEPPDFVTDWARTDGRAHHLFLFQDKPRLPDARGEREAVRAIAATLSAGQNTLVHCAGGANRSVYIAAKALMELGLDPVTAVERLRQRRGPYVLGNETFLGALVPQAERERLKRHWSANFRRRR